MTSRRATRLALTTTAAAAVSLVAASALPATAAGQSSKPKVTTLSTAVYAPFQLDFSAGSLYVADGGTSLVSTLTSHGLKTLATGPQPGEVAGVARDGAGSIAYTSLSYADGASRLTVKRPGRADLVADLSSFERSHNPDRAISYGVDNPTPCQVKTFAKAGFGPASYKGVVDSHPYAVTSLGGGSWAVAEAAGNDLLKVDSRGTISVIKVMPRQPFTITAALAASVHLAKCAVGVVYNFEPVPTDVEMGPDGQLYVSTLPGGPEDPSFGARGSIYRVNPTTGMYRQLATGLLGGTNVAVTSDGSVYAVQLFAGEISKVANGAVVPYLRLPGVVSLAAGNGHLYAGTLGPTDSQGNPTGPGSIVQIH